MRIEKEKVEMLINCSNLSEEEIKKLRLIPDKKALVNSLVTNKEFNVYSAYCFHLDISKSELSRTLLDKGMEDPDPVIALDLPRVKKGKNHTFLVSAEKKEELKRLLREINVKRVEKNEKPIKETEFVRRCIVKYLCNKGEGLL